MVLEVIKNIARASTKEKGLIHNIWAHDVAARLKMRRKSVANEMGLSDDWDVGTFPSSTVTINEPSGGGLLKGAALAAGLLAGGGTGGFLLSDVINADPQPVDEAVRETVEKSVPEVAFGEFMLELEQQEKIKQKLEGAWLE